MQASSISVAPTARECVTKWPVFEIRLWARVYVSLVLTLLTVTIALVPDMAVHLEFDRRAAAMGEWWRVMTGHFVHCNGEHLFWDLAVFAVLGTLCEWRDRRRFLLVLSLAGLIIPAAVWIFLPNLATYRGLSGLDSGLFALLAVSMLQEQWQEQRWDWVMAISGLLVGLAVKIGFELVTGSTLFVDTSAAGFEPVPLAHVVGAVVGGLAVAWPASTSPTRGD